MSSFPIPQSELIINKDGSIYHLNLCPDQIAHKIILVGDPHRVSAVSKHFSSIEHQCANREFVTHTGIFNGQRISVISTGIGTDNIDIVLNEIDALVNIDFTTRRIKDKHQALSIVRLGTSGSLRQDIDIDCFVLSEYVLGLDNVIYYYKDFEKVIDKTLGPQIIEAIYWPVPFVQPYLIKSSDALVRQISHHANLVKGITLTAPGFYGPQARCLRLRPYLENIEIMINQCKDIIPSLCITNFEMETSALYGLAQLLGHQVCTICLIVANRLKKAFFSPHYHQQMDKLILHTLKAITA